MENNKIKTFKDLKVWQEGHKLILLVYKLTESFPRSEMYSLIDQIRRSAISITSNIAEGFSRRSYKDRLRFYLISKGSITELESQFLIAKDLNYIDNNKSDEIFGQINTVHKLLNAFISATRLRVSKFSTSNLQPLISNQKGFSIIELIIYVAVLSVIAGMFVSALSQISVGWTRSKVESEVQQNLRFAMENISQSARSASAITFPAAGTSGTSTTMLINGQTVQYLATTTATSTILQKKVGASVAENITSDIVKVTYLNFKTFENNATTTGNVVKATATTTQFSVKVEYNSDSAQFQYTQSATSTEKLKN